MTQRMRYLRGRARSVVATGSAGMTTAEYAVGVYRDRLLPLCSPDRPSRCDLQERAHVADLAVRHCSPLLIGVRGTNGVRGLVWGRQPGAQVLASPYPHSSCLQRCLLFVGCLL